MSADAASTQATSAAAAPTPAQAAAVQACFTELTAWAAGAELTATGRAFTSDSRNLLRYATARNGDYPKALEQLKASLAWRETLLAGPLHCPGCDTDPSTHCFFPIGTSTPCAAAPDGAVVVYACAARARTNETAVTIQHMVHQLEHAWSVQRADKLCWLIDFHGFGLSHAMGGRTATTFLSHISAHLPERLHCAVLINPPSIFDLLLAVLRPFIDARTMSKVHIVRPKAGGVAAALAPFGVQEQGTLQWLEAALAMEAKPGSLPPLHPLGEAVAPMQLGHLRAAFKAPPQ